MLAKNTSSGFPWLCVAMYARCDHRVTAGIGGYFRLLPHVRPVREYERATRHVQRPERARRIPDLSWPCWLCRALLRAASFNSSAAVLMLVPVRGGLFLSFSRARGGNSCFCAVVMTVLLFMTSRSPRQYGACRIALLATSIAPRRLVALLLSVDPSPRCSGNVHRLSKSYDTGHFGRFGRHTSSDSISRSTSRGARAVPVPALPGRRRTTSFSIRSWPAAGSAAFATSR